VSLDQFLKCARIGLAGKTYETQLGGQNMMNSKGGSSCVTEIHKHHYSSWLGSAPCLFFYSVKAFENQIALKPESRVTHHGSEVKNNWPIMNDESNSGFKNCQVPLFSWNI